MDDQQKTALANSFSNIVRQTQTPGVDVQRLAMAFRMSLEQYEGGAIELQPLFDFLVNEQKVAENAVIELCVVLKSREQKLNVIFAQAHKQTFLNEEQVGKIVAAFNAKVDRSVGTWEKTGEVGTIPRSTPGTAIPKSGPGQPGLSPSKKRGQTKSRVPMYAAIFGVCIVGAIVFFTWRQQTAEPDLHEVPPIPDTAGVHCLRLITNGSAAICEIPRALAQSMPKETLESQAQITKRALGTGVQTLMVRTREDQKIVVLK